MVREKAMEAKAAAAYVRLCGTEQKNQALCFMAEDIAAEAAIIEAENQKDLQNAECAGIPEVMLDRLLLNRRRLDAVCAGLRHVAALPDPCGAYDKAVLRPNGLLIGQKRVPLGLVGIIYESRPNVTADAAALCLKSGNACLLRGGKEAVLTNTALVKAMQKGLARAGLPEAAVSLITDTSRESAAEMMGLTGILDVLIPRGNTGLIQTCKQNARVPVIETGTGNCHVYVDGAADLDMALKILVNAKCQRPSVCNACETLLAARSIAHEFLPRIQDALNASGHTVELRGCAETRRIIPVKPASQEDWDTEYLDYILAVRVVADVQEAAAHINAHSTHHSDCIVTRDIDTARFFTDTVDSAAVYVNASTRFTDGEVFGFGAEIGISTQKLHARGPMGLEHLTTIQYVVQGTGQIR